MPLYTTVDEVKSLFRRVKIEAATGDPATETVVTTEEVEQWIDDVEAVINAQLNRYYNIPIVSGTSPESFKIVALIAKLKTAAIVRGVLELDASSSEKMQSQKIDYGKKAEKLLTSLLPWFNKDVSDGEGRWEEPITPLPDAEAKAVTPFSGALFSTHVNASGEPKPTFRKNGNNW